MSIVKMLVILLMFYCFFEVSQSYEYSAWQSNNFSLFPKLPIAFPWSIDENCKRDSELLLENLKNETIWAMQMLDSSAQSPFGVLHGNVFHLGNFDECMGVKEPIATHMCLIKMEADASSVHLPQSDPFALDPPPTVNVWTKIRDSMIDASKMPRHVLSVGLCVPKSCQSSEVARAINQYLNESNEEKQKNNQTIYKIKIPNKCANNDQDPFTPDEIAFWCLLGLLLALVVISTAFESSCSLEKKGNTYQQLLLAFSLKKNWQMFTTRESAPGPLDFLYGVKFITIILIIYDHRIAIFLASTVFNYQAIEEELRGYNNLFLPHGDLLVDSFFYIGGLLSAYLTLEVYTKRFINPLLLIFGRYIRIMPLYFALIWFYASALLRLGSGIGWRIGLENVAKNCQTNWWTNLLMINNYVNADKMVYGCLAGDSSHHRCPAMDGEISKVIPKKIWKNLVLYFKCMLHAWYLACDFHYFIGCVLIIILLCKKPYIGQAVLFALLLISAAVPSIIVYAYRLTPNIIYYNEFLAKPLEDPTFLMLYIKTHTRGSVYIIGILSGYYFFRHKATGKKLGMATSLLCSTLGLALLFIPMAYGSLHYNPEHKHNLFEDSLFATLRRIIWGVGCTVLMFTYRFGNIPILGKMFSSETSIMLSKLTYSMYLVHFILQLSDYSKVKIPFHFLSFDMLKKGTTDTVFSMLISLLLYLVIEQPTRTVFKLLIFSRANIRKLADLPTVNPEALKSQESVKNSETPAVYSVKL